MVTEVQLTFFQTVLPTLSEGTRNIEAMKFNNAEIFPTEFLKGKMGLPVVDRDGVMALLEEEDKKGARLFDQGYPRKKLAASPIMR